MEKCESYLIGVEKEKIDLVRRHMERNNERWKLDLEERLEKRKNIWLRVKKREKLIKTRHLEHEEYDVHCPKTKQ